MLALGRARVEGKLDRDVFVASKETGRQTRFVEILSIGA